MPEVAADADQEADDGRSLSGSDQGSDNSDSGSDKDEPREQEEEEDGAEDKKPQTEAAAQPLDPNLKADQIVQTPQSDLNKSESLASLTGRTPHPISVRRADYLRMTAQLREDKAAEVRRVQNQSFPVLFCKPDEIAGLKIKEVETETEIAEEEEAESERLINEMENYNLPEADQDNGDSENEEVQPKSELKESA
jgi:hypothetical protein